MPWNATTFRKHNKKLTAGQSAAAAKIANAVLEKTGDEGMAIRTANARFKRPDPDLLGKRSSRLEKIASRHDRKLIK